MNEDLIENSEFIESDLQDSLDELAYSEESFVQLLNVLDRTAQIKTALENNLALSTEDMAFLTDLRIIRTADQNLAFESLDGGKVKQLDIALEGAVTKFFGKLLSMLANHARNVSESMQAMLTLFSLQEGATTKLLDALHSANQFQTGKIKVKVSKFLQYGEPVEVADSGKKYVEEHEKYCKLMIPIMETLFDFASQHKGLLLDNLLLIFNGKKFKEETKTIYKAMNQLVENLIQQGNMKIADENQISNEFSTDVLLGRFSLQVEKPINVTGNPDRMPYAMEFFKLTAWTSTRLDISNRLSNDHVVIELTRKEIEGILTRNLNMIRAAKKFLSIKLKVMAAVDALSNIAMNNRFVGGLIYLLKQNYKNVMTAPVEFMSHTLGTVYNYSVENIKHSNAICKRVIKSTV